MVDGRLEPGGWNDKDNDKHTGERHPRSRVNCENGPKFKGEYESQESAMPCHAMRCNAMQCRTGRKSSH